MFDFDLLCPVSEASILGEPCGDGGLFVSVMSSNILIFNHLHQNKPISTDQQIALTRTHARF